MLAPTSEWIGQTLLHESGFRFNASPSEPPIKPSPIIATFGFIQ